jgi:large subunit ribosomal protein L32e
MMVMKKKNKPKFKVLNEGSPSRRRVKARWRKPRGTHNKKRMKMAWTGASPRIGYRNPPAIRGLHPGGSREVLVHNEGELEGLEDVLVRIGSMVGARKREVLEKKADSMKLRVLNKRKKKSPKKKGTAKKGKEDPKKEGTAKKE